MELIQQELKYFTPTPGSFSGFTETTDAIIPDSYPDISEVAFSCATINVKDELPQTDRILVSGQIDAVVLYRTEDSQDLYRLNIPLSFAHIEETPGIAPQTLYFMQSGIAQVNVRIINSRKVSISCSAVLKSERCLPTAVSLTTDLEDADRIERRRRTSVLPVISGASIKRFVILDDIEMKQGVSSSPLHIKVDFTGAECSVSNGKIVLNGSAHLQIWDQTADNTVTLRAHDIPFHQIIETDSLADGMQTYVQLSCHSAICHYSNEDVLSVNLNTEGLFWQESQKKLEWIDDLYPLDGELQADFETISLASCCHAGSFSGTCSELLSTAHTVSDVLSASLLCTSILPSEENTLKLILACSILYLDDMRQPRQLDRQQTCSFQLDSPIEGKQPAYLQLQADASPQENQIALHIRLTGQWLQAATVTVPNLSNARVVSTTDTSTHPLKLLFIRESLPLWQIAKENRVTARAIREANHLAENVEQISNSVLLVP